MKQNGGEKKNNPTLEYEKLCIRQQLSYEAFGVAVYPYFAKGTSFYQKYL